MIALCVILVLLLLFLIIPVGVDVAFADGVFSLKAKIAFLHIGILPRKPKPPKEKKAAEDKPKEEKPKKEKKSKPKMKIGLEDIKTLLQIALKLLGRLRRKLSIDLFKLYVTVAADDPYDAVMRYGYLNAFLGSLSPLCRNAFKVRETDIKTAVDMEDGEMLIDARFVATYQIWELLYIALCAGFAALKWFLPKRKEMKKQEKMNTQPQEAETPPELSEKG